MKKNIELCGIGNALVDVQLPLSEVSLADLGLSDIKGQMRLVDGAKQAAILSKFKDAKPITRSGGSAANTVIPFSQFGGKSGYISILGNDEFGEFYAKEFLGLDIELRAPMLDNETTGVCLALITPDSERTMQTSLAVNSKLGPDIIDVDLIARSEWAYLEGYKFSEKSGAEAAEKAVEAAIANNTKIALAFSDVFITENFRDTIKKFVNKAQLVFCNEHEAVSFTQMKTKEDAFKALIDICPNVVMTMSGKGSLIQWDGTSLRVPAYQTKLVDSTGAGDSYAGGFFYGIIRLGSALKAGHLGAFTASKVISQFGPRLSNEDAKKLLADFNKLNIQD